MLAGLSAVAQNRPISKSVNFYSKEKEAALGAQLAEEFRKSTRLLDSAAAREYIGSVGREFAPQLPAGGPTYTFEVLAEYGSPLREPVVLPGGYIFVPAGLFLAAENEAEFVGMVAHAMAHVAARHATRMATRGQLVSTSSIPLVFMGGWSGMHGSESNVPIGFLSFLRAFELEADWLAVQTMALAGYEPSALLRYIDRMQTGAIGQLHSPLPPRERRIASLKQAIAELPPRDYSSGSGQFERSQKEVRGLVK